MAKSKRSRKKDVAVSNTSSDSASFIFSHIYLGPRTAASPAFISNHGITHVLSAGSTPPSTVSTVSYNRVALSDSTSSSIEAVSEKADAFIDAAKSGKILVHCSAAVSRSPTIVTAYLMKKHGMTLKEALGLIVRARPPACPNAGFLAQLKELEFKLYGVSSLDVDLLPAKREDRLALFHV